MAAKVQQVLDEDLRNLLTEAAEKLKGKFGADKITQEFQEGVVADRILGTAKNWKADLIVMGKRGINTDNESPIGSVTLRVLAHAPCSVRVVQDLSSPSVEKKLSSHAPLVVSRILLTVNDSENSMAAVESVLNRPCPSGTKVQVLTVIAEKSKAHSRFFKAPAISEAMKQLYGNQKAAAEKLAKQVADKLDGKFGKGNVTYHVLEGQVRALILQVAEDWPADMIVLGAHDQDKSILESVFGSVARAVATDADCPVEIIRKAP
jgi:nucleotide-binding universal stress UspA family protein